MNVLGLVFSLLLILSYGFYACWDKQTASNRLRTTYVAHEKVKRKLLNSYASEVYEHLGRKRADPKPQVEVDEEKEELDEEEKIALAAKPKKPDLNHECSKLNLWPLIQEGRENHPLLYELAAKLIRTFYASLNEREKRFEYHLLDALISAAKAFPQNMPFAFEKIDLKERQRLYYKMLRGTKEWDLAANRGYPPLLDYIKANHSQDKICLYHAHPDVFTVLFGAKVAANLYPVIHQQGGPALTQELVEKFCSEVHITTLEPELFKLLEYGHPHHEEHKKALVAYDSHISLRQTVYLKDEKK